MIASTSTQAAPPPKAIESALAPVPAPVVTTIGQIEAMPGVPAEVSNTLAQLTNALNSQSPPTPVQVAALLTGLASNPGVPASTAGALNELATTLAQGATPTPADLSAGLASLIKQLAGSPGLPGQASTGLTQLADALLSTMPPTSAQVTTTLRQLAGTPGVPAAAAQGINGLAGALGESGSNGSPGGGSTGGAASPFGSSFNPSGSLASGHDDSAAIRALGIVVKSVRFNAKRHTVIVVVMCNAQNAPCKTAVAVFMGRTRVAGPAVKLIGSRRHATFTLRLSRSKAASIARRGAMLRVNAVSSTTFGPAHSAKSLRVKRSHK